MFTVQERPETLEERQAAAREMLAVAGVDRTRLEDRDLSRLRADLEHALEAATAAGLCHP